MNRLFLALALCALALPALAQSGAPSMCGGVVGATAAAVVFPTAGQTGPGRPQLYITIANPTSGATLYVNPFGGTAIASDKGSISIPAGALVTWAASSGYPPPAALSIIASTSSTPYYCAYQ